MNIQGEIRWLRGKSIEYEREPLRLRDLIKGKKEFLLLLFDRRLSDLAPKWSGKAPNGVMMGDEYPQTPYGDFWTDSGTFSENAQNH